MLKEPKGEIRVPTDTQAWNEEPEAWTLWQKFEGQLCIIRRFEKANVQRLLFTDPTRIPVRQPNAVSHKEPLSDRYKSITNRAVTQPRL